MLKTKKDFKEAQAKKMPPALFNLWGAVICFSLTIILLAGVYFFYRKFISTQKAIVTQETRLKSLKESARDLEAKLGEYSQDRSKFEAVSFKEEEVPLFLEGISSDAKKFNVRITEMRALPRKAVETSQPGSYQGSVLEAKPAPDDLYLASIPSEITVKGKTQDVIRFVSSIERNKKLLSISDINIRVEIYPEVRCSFHLDLYCFKAWKEIR